MFCLSGKSSILSCDVFPAIDVSEGEWELSFIDMTTYNSIPNIEEGVNNIFYYANYEIKLPTGSYEIEDIERYILRNLTPNVTFSLKPNNNTLKAEIQCSESIDFSKAHSLVDLLGFESKTIAANTKETSSKPVNIVHVNSICIECNIVRGSYKNGVEEHIIHEFYPSVSPGFKIIENPSNLIYLPVNVQRINNITVFIKDENGRLVNFRGEEIILRLHLRRNNNGFAI